MSQQAFKVPKGEPPLEIPTAGIADDTYGVPLELAAGRLHELQDTDGVPLSGAALQAAAKKLAKKLSLVIGPHKERDLTPPDEAVEAPAPEETSDESRAAQPGDASEE